MVCSVCGKAITSGDPPGGVCFSCRSKTTSGKASTCFPEHCASCGKEIGSTSLRSVMYDKVFCNETCYKSFFRGDDFLEFMDMEKNLIRKLKLFVENMPVNGLEETATEYYLGYLDAKNEVLDEMERLGLGKVG